jgi:hypothetical protein
MDVFHLVDVPRRRRRLRSPIPSSHHLFRGRVLPGLCVITEQSVEDGMAIGGRL